MDLLTLKARLGLDKSEYEDGLKDAKNKASSFGDALKKGLSVAAKVSVAALSTASTAIIAVGKQAVSAYGDFEQLSGGIETLFGTGGLTIEEYAAKVGKAVNEVSEEYGRLEKAQELMMLQAEAAWKSSGLSANEYMETATSFAAALTSSCEDTVEAAKVADVAIVDMSDNANKMGSSMESIQNAYQGFAKQNYTMLDNLKLGYGGTKEEMERLIEDANKLRAAQGLEGDLTIEKYSDIVMAIHEVQTEMGIYGTTAKEATETIQGSFSMMSASWENFVAGIANPDADLSQLSGDLVESATAVVDHLIPIIVNTLPRVAEGLGAVIGTISDQLPTLIGELLPPLIGATEDLFNGLIAALPQIFDMIMQVLPSLIDTLLQALPVIIEVGMQMIMALTQGLVEYLPVLIPALVEVVLNIVTYLLDNIDLLIDCAIQLIFALAEGLIAALPILIEKAPEIVIKLVEGLLNALPQIGLAASQLIMELVAGLIASIPKIIEVGAKLTKALIDKIKFFKDNFKTIGKDLIDGLWNGIKETWGKVTDWVSDSFTGLVDKVKGIFGIHSPSRVFKQIGEFVVEGFDDGVEGLADVSDLEKNVNASIDHINGNVNPIEVTSKNIPSVGIVPFSNTKTGLLEQSENSKLADMIGEAVAYSLQALNVSAKIDIEADDRRLFKVVQEQARIYSKTTGQGAFV